MSRSTDRTDTRTDDGRAAPREGTGGRTRRLPLVVVAGVAASGKTTVGRLLAGRLEVPYADADDFHPRANVAKMSAGEPLDDEDRRPWLDAIAGWLGARGADGGVVSCSALRRRYRDRLAAAAPGVFFLHLDGSEELIARRIAAREGHFMPPALLRSQFEALEPLEPDENGAAVPVDGPVEETTGLALEAVTGRSAGR